MSNHKENYQRFESSPKGKFGRQRANAKTRTIPWHFTFEEWMKLWEESGHWHERGTQPGQYYMCRKGDVGPYSVDNVEIKTHSENALEAWEVRKQAALQPPVDPWRLVDRKSAWDYEVAGKTACFTYSGSAISEG